MQTTTQIPISIHPATPDVLNFILNSWLTSYSKLSHFARGIPSRHFFHYHHTLLSALLSRSECLVAVDQEDPNLYYGWIVYDKNGSMPCLHYCYVKKQFRQGGIGRELLKATGINTQEPFAISHQTFAWTDQINQHYRQALYIPYRAFMT